MDPFRPFFEVGMGVDDPKYIEKLKSELAIKDKTISDLKRNLEKIIEEKTSALRQANEKLSLLASIDPLTECFNRREFDLKLLNEVERSNRYNREFTLAMIDIDEFKQLNDEKGHAFGDRVLKVIAKIFSSNLRKTDVIARFGGDEFVLILPETHPKKAMEICDRLRTIIEEAFKAERKVTASFGLASFPQSGNKASEILENADKALYEAKHFGRNKVVLKESDVPVLHTR